MSYFGSVYPNTPLINTFFGQMGLGFGVLDCFNNLMQVVPCAYEFLLLYKFEFATFFFY